MNDATFWVFVFGFVFIFEGVIPTLFPQVYKKMIAKMASQSENQIRVFGLSMMLLGLALIVLFQ